MDGIEVRKLIDRMKPDIEQVVEERRAQCAEYTKTPRTLDEMLEWMAETRKETKRKIDAIFNNYYDRYTNTAR